MSVCPSPCADGAVQLNSGYIRIQSGFFSVDSLLLSVRTRSPDTVLATFGNVAALILQHGSLVYVRRNITQAGSYFAAITIATHAYISDGLWHDIMLTLGDSLTKVCSVGVAYSVGVICKVGVACRMGLEFIFPAFL